MDRSLEAGSKTAVVSGVVRVSFQEASRRRAHLPAADQRRQHLGQLDHERLAVDITRSVAKWCCVDARREFLPCINFRG